MPVSPEKNPTKEVMADGPFYVIFFFLLLSSGFLFAACIGIVRQGNLGVVPHGRYGSGKSYVIYPNDSPHEFWATVVVAGVVGALLLILDLWMLVRHRRAKREAE